MTNEPLDTGSSSKQVLPFVRRTLSIALTAPGFTSIAAVFGVAVLVTVILQFGVSWVVISLGIVLTILLAVLYLCFSWLTNVRSKHRTILAGLLAYPVVIVVSASSLFVFFSAFFDTPLPLKTLIVAKLGSQTDAKILLEEKTETAVTRSAQAERQINTIIVSETATPPALSTNKLVDSLHTQRSGIGYHFIIDRSGLVYPMTDVGRVVGHTAGNNQDSIGIGLEHNTGEPFTDAQIAGLKKLLTSLVHRLKLDPNRIFSKEEIDPQRYKRDITPLMPKIRSDVKQQTGSPLRSEKKGSGITFPGSQIPVGSRTLMRTPVVKRQTSPQSGFFTFFRQRDPGSILLWQRVLTGFLSAGTAIMWLHQTLLEGRPPGEWRLQRTWAWFSAP